MARKDKKKTEMTELEKALLEGYENNENFVEYSCRVGEKEFPVKIKKRLDLETKVSLIGAVEDVYFSNGDYNSVFGDLLMEQLVFSAYTDMRFDDDISLFYIFKESPEYDQIMKMMPPERGVLFYRIEDKLNFLKTKHSYSEEQSAFYNALTGVLKETSDLMEHLETALDDVADKLPHAENFNVKEILSAITKLEKKDESKIARAVLDFQEAKAKKEQEGNKPTGEPVARE